MSKFKVGDKIIRTSQGTCWAPIGYKTTVLEGYKYKDKNSSILTDIVESIWELAKVKWTIYNNTLPWSELSDKQKGKMLLARHCENLFTSNHTDIACYPKFSCLETTYQAVKPVKPESTMEELFKGDWYDCLANGGKYEQMIAKGWVKK
jgi:hypothetical protein